MPTIAVPHFFERCDSATMLHLDAFSSVLYNQTVEQKNVSICVTTSMLVILLKGKKIIHTGQEDIEIGAGDMFFIERGTYLLSKRLNVNNTYQSLIFFMDDAYLRVFAKSNIALLRNMELPTPKQPGIYKITAYPLLAASTASLLPCFQSSYPNRKELLKVKLNELLLHLINTDQSRNFLTFLNLFLHPLKHDLKQYMLENYCLPLTLDTFAKQTGRSLTTFKNEFRELFLMPPKKWINSMRLERAHTLLRSTSSPVTTICYDAGFENLSHFCQLFKKRYGISPKKLQQQ